MSLNRQHVRIFIGLSLAMHAAVLTVVLPDNTALFTEQRNRTLDIELVAEHSDVKAPQPQPIEPKKAHHPQKITTVASPVAITEQKLTDAPTANATPVKQHDVAMLATENAVSQKISIALLRYFHYPDAAVRRNWQGDVILQFTLLPDGHLEHIRIHQSSGYKALDDAALHALQQVEPQQELALLTDASMLHILPVSYRLSNPL